MARERRGLRSRSAASIVAVAVASGGAGVARAADRAPTVALEIEACPALPASAVRRALQVEIGDRLAPDGGGAGARPNRLVVSCDGGAGAVVTAERPAAGTRIERRLALDDLPADTAPRVVALAGLELLAVLDPELRWQPRPADVAVRDGTAPPRAAAPSRIASWRVLVAGVHRSFVATSGIAAWGGQLTLDRPRLGSPGSRFGAGVGFEAGGARRGVALGEATALLLSGSAAASWRAGDGDPLALLLELGARGGVAWLSGTAPARLDVTSTSVARPWGGPFVAVRLLLARGHVCASLAAEAGVAAVSATGLADDAPALAARGPWVALSLGAGFQR